MFVFKCYWTILSKSTGAFYCLHYFSVYTDRPDISLILLFFGTSLMEHKQAKLDILSHNTSLHPNISHDDMQYKLSLLFY